MTNFDTCEKYQMDRSGQLRGRIQQLQNPIARSLPPLLEKPRCEPSQVFDFDLGAIDEIFGAVFDKNDPAKSGDREKC
jgi:hypothetical protein